MLGFGCCCAAAGGFTTIPPATNASRASQSFRMTVMENLLTFQGSWESANETTPPGIALLQRPAVFQMTGDSNSAGPVSAMQSVQPVHPLALLRAQQMTTPARGRTDLVDISGSQRL
jgi:hypothetical protein